MAGSINFQPYLDSICSRYTEWWKLDTLASTSDSQKPLFDFEQMAHLVISKHESNGVLSQEQPKSFLLVQGLWEYVGKGHVLLLGRPGAGKSTALARFLVDAAKQAESDPTLQKPQTRIPVLVELGLYPARLRNESGILDLIEDSLEANECPLEIATIRTLLVEKRFLLLLDGVNELPKEALTDLKAFERKPLPMVFTTRDSDQGGLDNIKQKLELQPLSPEEVQRFIQKQMPGQDGQKLKQLSDRIRDFGETPLVVWMLYQVFRQTGDVPETLGEALREFTKRYERNQKAGKVIEAARDLLRHLAFEMMHSEKPTNEEKAVEIFRQFLEHEQTPEPTRKAREYLENLLNHHLIQHKGKNQIRFCHQLLQEYYAAEKLLEMLQQKHPDLVEDKRFQHYYLNYLKWTEGIALMMGLLNNGTQAVELVEQTLEVDFILGARFAGQVKPDFQPHTVASTIQKIESVVPENPAWFKLKVLEEIGTKEIITYLVPLLDCPDSYVSRHAYFALMLIDPEAVPEQSRFKQDLRRCQHLLKIASESLEVEEQPPLPSQILENLVSDIRSIFNSWVSKELSSEEVITKLNPLWKSPDSEIRWSITEVLGSLNCETVLPVLLRLIEDPTLSVRHAAAKQIGRLSFKSAIPGLIHIIKHNSSPEVRCSAILALRIIGSEEILPGILRAMQDPDSWVCLQAIEASEKIDSEAIIPGLLAGISRPETRLCRLAAYHLRMLSLKENINKSLSKNYIQTLVQLLEHADTWVRWRIVFTLWNVASETAIPLLHPKLNHPNPDIGLATALVLGRFGHEDAVPGLVRMMKYSNLSDHPDIYEISYMAAYALGQVEGNATAKYLPELLSLIPTPSGENSLRAISKIQEQYKFYNYDIAQSSPPLPIDSGKLSANGSVIYNIGNVAQTVYGNQITNQQTDLNEQE